MKPSSPKTLLATAVLAALTAESAFAQLEEVVVTAERREASVQDTPISIDALSEKAIQERGIQNNLDLINQVAGMQGMVPRKVGLALHSLFVALVMVHLKYQLTPPLQDTLMAFTSGKTRAARLMSLTSLESKYCVVRRARCRVETQFPVPLITLPKHLLTS